MPLKISIHTDPARIRSQDLAHLYKSVGFGDMQDIPQSAYSNDLSSGPGLHCVFATDEAGTLVGITRVFSDDMMVTHVSDICVAPALRQRGIGSAMMNAVLHRFHHTAIFASIFAGQAPFFERFGLRAKAKLCAVSRAPDPLV